VKDEERRALPSFSDTCRDEDALSNFVPTSTRGIALAGRSTVSAKVTILSGISEQEGLVRTRIKMRNAYWQMR